VSPDSRFIAFVGRSRDEARLFVRDLGSLEAVVVPGTQGARQPFWSPDSRFIAFFAAGRLMKVTWPGGAPVAIANAPEPRGGSWSRAGSILFAPDLILAGIDRLSADGDTVEPATRMDIAKGDTSHWWPSFLPDGAHFLYFVRSASDDRRGIYVERVDGPRSDRLPLLRSDSEALYVPLAGSAGGVLLYVDEERITARRFDPGRLTAAADARTLGLAAAGGTLYHPMMMSASSEVLAFAPATIPQGNRLELVGRTGQRLRMWDPEGQNWPRLSPDGKRLARQRVHPLRNTPDVWVEDLERGTDVRVTTAVNPDIMPVWSPDGRHLAFVTGGLPGRPGERVLNIAAADGTGVFRSFKCPASYCEPTDWSPDGTHLVINVIDERSRDIWKIPIDGAAAQPILAEPFVERDARISPNGRSIAYVSEESGRPEVSVRSLAGAPERIVASPDGGAQPVWRRDGSELFFVDMEGRLRSLSVRWSADRPSLGLPVPLDVPPVGFGHWGTQYDVVPDGSGIYMLRRNEAPPPTEIHVVLGWRALLE
jgi:dipeptidyl aminopeptidase/acylaminoacyl peptidase